MRASSQLAADRASLSLVLCSCRVIVVSSLVAPHLCLFVAAGRFAWGRLREAVGELGQDTAAEVTETATLKANNKDIKWQVCDGGRVILFFRLSSFVLLLLLLLRHRCCSKSLAAVEVSLLALKFPIVMSQCQPLSLLVMMAVVVALVISRSCRHRLAASPQFCSPALCHAAPPCPRPISPFPHAKSDVKPLKKARDPHRPE